MSIDFFSPQTHVVRVSNHTQNNVYREHEHRPENSNEQKERRVCCAVGRTNVFESDEIVRFDEPNMDERTAGFRRPG